MLSGKVLPRRVENLVAFLSTEEKAVAFKATETACDKPLLEFNRRGKMRLS